MNGLRKRANSLSGRKAPGLKRLRKKFEHWTEPAISGAAGAKARLILLRLLARLKSCPVAKRYSSGVLPQPAKPILFAVIVLWLGLPAWCEAGPTVRVEYTNPGLTPSEWTLVLRPDGTGHFNADRGVQVIPANEARSLEAAHVDRDITVSREFARYVFATVHHHSLLNVGCESHLKVAFQGWKKIHYAGPDGEGGCEFNYSKDREIQELGESLVAVATTLIEGARLELLLQHDPLGLDQEIQYILEALQDGRLVQIGVIRGILTRLEDDPAVLDRVRKKAKELLAKADK
jgi:hypothetical protein